MKRLLLVFVLLVIPLQASWAAVAAYCKHENGVAAMLVGHHFHKHQGTAGDAGGDPTRGVDGIDGDCGFCFLGTLNFVQSAFSLPQIDLASNLHETPLRFHPSFIPKGLERPNWRVIV